MDSSSKAQLETSLFAPENSHSRGYLVNNQLFFDLKLASAERGCFINLYLPEVDKDGFDIIRDYHRIPGVRAKTKYRMNLSTDPKY